MTDSAISLGRILIVDSDPAYRHQCSDIFSAYGYTVDQAATHAEALALYHHARPVAIFCDLELPSTSGTEFLKTIRKLDKTTPFVVLAEEANMAGALSGLRFGAQDFVTKPFPDPSLLMHTLRSLLIDDEQQQQDEMEIAISELSYNRQELRNDEAMASLFQASLLPQQQFDIGRYRVSWRMPLKPQANRYFLDVFPVSDDQASFYIADFGDNNLDAAFASGALKVVFNEALRESNHNSSTLLRNPAQVMSWANHYLSSLNLKEPPALVYGLIDAKNGRMKWANAAFDKGPYVWFDAATQALADPGPELALSAPANAYRCNEFNVDEGRPLVFSHLPGEQLKLLAKQKTTNNLPIPVSDLLTQALASDSDNNAFSFVIGRTPK
ncbi:response regulator [Neiella marina]|uniref:Response regulator n=1 Tax=Neiella holothuriorum TaxID=2870530 RepID=A0ABS7EEM7_9GAMM|nr:response regulator [Neiella holothuriorum]MBW8190768.1 response regulator [Neiella holothuriorum]